MKKFFVALMAVSALSFTAQAADSVESQQNDQIVPASEQVIDSDSPAKMETDSFVEPGHGGGGGGHVGGGGGHVGGGGGGFHPAPGGNGGFHPAPGGNGGFHPAPGGNGGFHPAPGGNGGWHPGNPGGNGGWHPGNPGNGGWHPGLPGGFHPGQPGWHPGHEGFPGWRPFPGHADWRPGFPGWYEGYGWWPHAYAWRPYPVIVYPVYNEGWEYECSASDEFGRTYSDSRVFDPQDLMLDVIVNCEQQSGGSCTAIECHHYTF